VELNCRKRTVAREERKGQIANATPLMPFGMTRSVNSRLIAGSAWSRRRQL
jgi:hypothetical protein